METTSYELKVIKGASFGPVSFQMKNEAGDVIIYPNSTFKCEAVSSNGMYKFDLNAKVNGDKIDLRMEKEQTEKLTLGFYKYTLCLISGNELTPLVTGSLNVVKL